MSNPFSAVFAVVEQAARDLAGELVTYRRGADEIQITAVVGSHPETTVDTKGVPVTIRQIDFAIAAVAIDFGSGPVEPQAGDEIDRAVGAATETYRVAATSDDRGYRRSDPDKQTWRVRAERVT